MSGSEPTDGWRWFSDDAPAPVTERDREIAAAFARCFATPDGARVLETLRAMTLERALGPEAGDAALRHLEGQRRMVVTIGALIRRGREGAPVNGREGAP